MAPEPCVWCGGVYETLRWCSFSSRLIQPQYNKGKLLQTIIPAIARLFNTQSIYITITHTHRHLSNIYIIFFLKSLIFIWEHQDADTSLGKHTHLSPCFVVPLCVWGCFYRVLMLTLMLMSWSNQIRSLIAAIDWLILSGRLLQSAYVIWAMLSISSLPWP